MHAARIQWALKNTYINTIFIIVQYRNRWEEMLEDFLEVSEPFTKHMYKIVIMVSHWDHCENRDIARSLIIKLFSDFTKNIIFYSNKF